MSTRTKKPKTRGPTDKEIRAVLSKIASMGVGMKPEVIDWQNIGKNAVKLAQETFRDKCVECGK